MIEMRETTREKKLYFKHEAIAYYKSVNFQVFQNLKNYTH